MAINFTKLLYLALFFLPFFNKVQAQEYEISIGETFEFKIPYQYLYCANEDDIVSVTILENLDQAVQTFDKASLKKRAEVTYKKIHKNVNYFDLVYLNGKFQLIYESFDKETKSERVFAQALDAKTGKLAGKAKLLFKLEKKIMGQMVNKGGNKLVITNKFHLEYAKDKKSFLFYYTFYPEHKNDHENYQEYGFHVLDEELNVIWNNSYKLPTTENRTYVKDIFLSSWSDVYMLLSVHPDPNMKKYSSRDQFEYQLFKASKNSATLEKQNIFVNKNRNYYKPKIYENDSGELYVTCFHPDAIYFNHVDSSLVSLNTNLVLLPDSILNMYDDHQVGHAYEYERETIPYDITLDTLFTDGENLIVFGEEEKNYSRLYQIGKYTSTTLDDREYIRRKIFFGDIIIANISKDGTLNWMNRIPKSHWGYGDWGLSYRYLQDETYHYFIYQDNQKNLSREKDKFAEFYLSGGRVKGDLLMCTRINRKTGLSSTSVIADLKNLKDKRFSYFDKNRFIIFDDGEFAFEINTGTYKCNWINVKIK